jgi:glycosyltransferase involved in cell wall biosynthesis
MTKVCHFSSAHRGLDIRIYRKQCLSLAAAGFDTHLVIVAAPEEVAEAAVQGVTVHALALPSGRLARMVLQSWRCYRIAKKLNADIYHFHDPELIPYGLLLYWQGKKVVIDLHEDLRGDIQSKNWIPLPLRQVIGAAARALEQVAARRFSAVVAATPFIGELFERTARCVTVVHNYPTIDELTTATASVETARDSMCYVGRIDDIRGIREIVRAAELAKCKLLLAGRFATSELRREVEAMPGWRHVKDLGFVGRTRIAQTMAASFCGLVTLHPVPNFINSLPIKLFEYMSAGVPVIASDFPLWREIIDDANCGLCVDPSDPAAIVQAIDYLRSHPELARQMGRNGRRAIETRYRWDCEADKLAALYREITAA